MVQTVRRMVFALALATLLAADGYGQVPQSSPLQAQLAPPITVPPTPPAADPPAPPCAALVTGLYEDRNGPLLSGHPLLDPPNLPEPGCLALVEVEAIKPTFRGRIGNAVTVAGDTHLVNGRFSPLDWTVAPRVDVGYRLGGGFGEFLVSYRFISSDGSSVATDFDANGPATIRTRLNVNTIDLLYANHEPSLGPDWDMRWDVGTRLLGLYLDSQAVGPSLEQRVSSNYLAGGVKGGLMLYRKFDAVPGLAIGGRFNGAYLLGQMKQSFDEVQTLGGGPAVGGAGRTHAGQAIWVMDLQAGVSYAPPWADGRFRVDAGYQFEYWYSITEALANRGTLEGQGVYLRFAYNY